MEEKFNIVKKGYDPVEVNKYIDTLEEVLKSYKDKDAAIKNAILSAQVAADNMLSAARAEAAGIIKEAEQASQRIQEETTNSLMSIIAGFQAQRQALKSFRHDYNAMLQKYLQQMDDDDISTLVSELERIEKTIPALINSAIEPQEAAAEYPDEPSVGFSGESD